MKILERVQLLHTRKVKMRGDKPNYYHQVSQQEPIPLDLTLEVMFAECMEYVVQCSGGSHFCSVVEI